MRYGSVCFQGRQSERIVVRGSSVLAGRSKGLATCPKGAKSSGVPRVRVKTERYGQVHRRKDCRHQDCR